MEIKVHITQHYLGGIGFAMIYVVSLVLYLAVRAFIRHFWRSL